MKQRVLILCTKNSCRSQMAEGILRHYGGDRFEAFSAGTVASHVNENAIRVMREIGIDISGQKSKSLEQFLDHPFDFVITVCDNAKETCPFFPGAKHKLHWSFPDPPQTEEPNEEYLREFRAVRDMILVKFKQAAEEGIGV
jgi:arsenate reductase (thioredoxin)